MAQSDEALMEQVAAGDTTAFELLLSRHEHRLYNYILRLMGDPEESHDVFQDTFMRVYKHAARFDTRRRFSTWLYTIATNAVRDRQRRKRPEVSLDAALTGGEDPRDLHERLPQPGASPLETAANTELEQRVRQAIDALPEGQRQVLVLREYEQLSCQEISEVLDLPSGTVKSRIYYAMAALREQLAPLANEGVG